MNTKILSVLLCLFLTQACFGQLGTYELVSIPSEAWRDLPENDEGRIELPIYLGTVTIHLKPFHRVRYVCDEHKTNETVTTGKWSLEGGRIRLVLEGETGTETADFDILEYKSGIYLKPVDSFHYYKKR